jgi:hypothetical protein
MTVGISREFNGFLGSGTQTNGMIDVVADTVWHFDVRTLYAGTACEHPVFDAVIPAPSGTFRKPTMLLLM